MILFSNFFIEKIKGEIEYLETELNHHHNDISISPALKVKKIKKILNKISKKKQTLEIYVNYILESKEKENGDGN